ncbi:MAG: glucose-6-phosphate 1-dehydrogenase [Saprospiraceae bacterium]|nr:MAG: glucose-6-phosphate 1-dehydrogenase [Saprospiraceae bacterium]
MNPQLFVIFGASGDLTARKLIPALLELFKNKTLPKPFGVLGVSRTEYSDEAFRKKAVYDNEHLKKKDVDQAVLKEFADHLFYQPIDTGDGKEYHKVAKRLDELDKKLQTNNNYIFYLSVPPKLYETIPAFLANQKLNNQKQGWKRLVIEKPFGSDKESAILLNDKLQENFEENQIFRIDHYLGKETVQNLLVTRFANGIFEPLWNRNYIHHIEITAAENIGVENRGGYYDTSGALRDMIQNHLLQIVAHLAMEPPNNADAQSIRNEKLKLFQSIRPILEHEVSKYVIRGQYTGAKVEGKKVNAYREEDGVGKDSRAETYVAMKFFIDNWRWADVPFFIRTGKRLPTKVTEAVVNFKSPPHHLFRKDDSFNNKLNQLIIRINPDEGLALQFGMKIPGAGFRVKNVDMDFHYSDLTNAYVPEAYQRLLLDVMKGDATLYSRGDSVESAWEFVDPILNAWEKNPDLKLYGYPAGSWGPREADLLIGSDQVSWRNPCSSLATDGAFEAL